ncbi:MAG: hypothetical protein ACE5DW_07265 [Thermodesulfobacteriota bacterium]
MTLGETTLIREPIEVIALFDQGVKPLRFRWKGSVYKVREITFTWTTMSGAAPVLHFSAYDGATLYELSYNKATLKWILEGVALHE